MSRVTVIKPRRNKEMEKFEDKKVVRWDGKILVPALCSSNRGETTSLAPFTGIKINVFKGIFVFECF